MRGLEFDPRESKQVAKSLFLRCNRLIKNVNVHQQYSQLPFNFLEVQSFFFLSENYAIFVGIAPGGAQPVKF